MQTIETVKLFPLISRAAGVSETPRENRYWKGIKAVCVTTVLTGGKSITFGVYGQDAFGNEYTLIEKSITTQTTTILTLYPSLAVSAGVSANDVLPSQFHVKMVPNDSTPYTASASYDLIP